MDHDMHMSEPSSKKEGRVLFLHSLTSIIRFSMYSGRRQHVSTNGHQYNSWNIETFVEIVCYPHNILTRTCKTLRIPYSAKIPTASSLHFSTGSDSTFRRGFTRNSISPCSTSGEWAGLLPTVSRLRRSKALLRVVRLSSERQFTSRWSF